MFSCYYILSLLQQDTNCEGSVNPLWRYFKKNSGGFKAVCTLCPEDVQTEYRMSKHSTSNLWTHLKRKHAVQYELGRTLRVIMFFLYNSRHLLCIERIFTISFSRDIRFGLQLSQNGTCPFGNLQRQWQM